MVAESTIPEPEDSGGDGSQVKADDAAQDLVPAQPLASPIANTITVLASTHSRAFGGEVASALVAGATSQMAAELQQTKRELSATRERLSDATSDLANEKVKSAVLRERLQNFRSTRHLKNFGVAVGTMLLGFGVPLVLNGKSALGLTATIIGAIIIIISWVSVPKGGDE